MILTTERSRAITPGTICNHDNRNHNDYTRRNILCDGIASFHFRRKQQRFHSVQRRTQNILEQRQWTNILLLLLLVWGDQHPVHRHERSKKFVITLVSAAAESSPIVRKKTRIALHLGTNPHTQQLLVQPSLQTKENELKTKWKGFMPSVTLRVRSFFQCLKNAAVKKLRRRNNRKSPSLEFSRDQQNHVLFQIRAGDGNMASSGDSGNNNIQEEDEENDDDDGDSEEESDSEEEDGDADYHEGEEELEEEEEEEDHDTNHEGNQSQDDKHELQQDGKVEEDQDEFVEDERESETNHEEHQFTEASTDDYVQTSPTVNETVSLTASDTTSYSDEEEVEEEEEDQDEREEVSNESFLVDNPENNTFPVETDDTVPQESEPSQRDGNDTQAELPDAHSKNESVSSETVAEGDNFTKQTSKKKARSHALPFSFFLTRPLSLFHFHNSLKASVSLQDDDFWDLLFLSTSSSKRNGRRQKRGGAFLATPKHSPATTKPPLLLPSPSSSADNNPKIKSPFSRLWWNQAWMAHMPQPDLATLTDEADANPEEQNVDDNDEEESEEEEGNARTNDIVIVLEDEIEVQLAPSNQATTAGGREEKEQHAEPTERNTSSTASAPARASPEFSDDVDPTKEKENEYETRKEEQDQKAAGSNPTKKKKKKKQLQQQRASEDATTISSAAVVDSDMDIESATSARDANETNIISPELKVREQQEGEEQEPKPDVEQSNMTYSVTTPFTSSGAWVLIDAVVAPGYVQRYWKPSQSLRPLRKKVAYWTGMHGVLSGKRIQKKKQTKEQEQQKEKAGDDESAEDDITISSDEDLVRAKTETIVEEDETLQTTGLSDSDVVTTTSITTTATTTPEATIDNRPFFLQRRRKVKAIEQTKEEESQQGQRRRRNPFAFWNREPKLLRQGSSDDDEDDTEEERKDDEQRIVSLYGDNALGEKATGVTASSENDSKTPTSADSAKQANNGRMAPFRRQKSEDLIRKELEEERRLKELEQQRQRRRQLSEEEQKQQRLKEIDQLIQKKSEEIGDLATEKDLILNLLNPLWNYTSATSYDELNSVRQEAEERDASQDAFETIRPQKEFNFPSDDLVEEYITALVQSERLIKMNHTDLWRNGEGSDSGNGSNEFDDYDDLDDEDEWLSPTELAQRRRIRARNKAVIQKQKQQQQQGGNNNNNHRNGENSGSRWLRIKGVGEKLGQTIEDLVYKAICFQVMGGLARGVAGGLHGINIMGHADIGIKAEQTPVVPPNVAAGPYSNIDSYARQAFQNAISKQSSSNRNKKRKIPTMNAADSVQRYAVIETLLSQCQVAMPLLKMFPLVWQRALIGNLVTVITVVLSDFLEGLEVQVLGYRLELALKPITEQDVMRRLEQQASQRHFSFKSQYPSYPQRSYHQEWSGRAYPSYWQGGGGGGGSSGNAGGYYDYFDDEDQEHPARSQQAFEAAVQATANDLAANLNFLDKWHERVFLGGDAIRMQVATLIARVVLSLIDDILSDARIDLWSPSSTVNKQKRKMTTMMLMGVGGPRLKAGLYYRNCSTKTTAPTPQKTSAASP